jgi:tripartite-type tricarboxylate transporter receptor subunit TctC
MRAPVPNFGDVEQRGGSRMTKAGMRFLFSLVAYALVASSAAAQDVASFYRGKTVRIVVGFSAGGGFDQYARVLSRHIGRHIPGNPTVIVQNMPGAASLNSVKFLATAAPTDGTVINAFNPGLITQSLTVPDKIGLNFLDFGWLGSITEDFRACHTWNGTGIKSWQELLARPRVAFGNTGVGTASYIDGRILSELFGVKVHQVLGYPGSTEKRIAIERGELDGDCTGWTAIPEQWVRDGKITIHLRFSRTLLPGMPAAAAVARDLLTDPGKQQILDVLTAASLVGRPYIVPKAVPADRLAALRTAFDATMQDPEFLAECAKQQLTVSLMTGAEVETFIKELSRTPPDVVAAAKTISGD